MIQDKVNTAGEAQLKLRKTQRTTTIVRPEALEAVMVTAATDTSHTATVTSSADDNLPPLPSITDLPPSMPSTVSSIPQALFPLGSNIVDIQLPLLPRLPLTAPNTGTASSQAKSTLWYRQKRDSISRERVERGEPPIKKYKKTKDFITCKVCGQPRRKETGHTQMKGRWWCPSSDVSLEVWKENVKK